MLGDRKANTNNKLNTDGNFQIESIAEADQITTQDGDVIGIHYEDSNDGNGVILYERSGGDLCCGFDESDLSRLVNKPMDEDDLAVGVTIPKSLISVKRMVALKAMIGNVTS